MDGDERPDRVIRKFNHDLRNHLAAIRNALELLKRDAGTPKTFEFACGIIDKQVHELERLADDVLDAREGGAAAPEQRVRTVLLADDDHDSADSLAAALRLEGFMVRAAYGGEEALQAAAAERPDVMIVDIGMPRLSGYDVARQIRSLRREERPVMIALTAWGQESDKLLSRQAGFDHHLTKPIAPAELARLLKKL